MLLKNPAQEASKGEQIYNVLLLLQIAYLSYVVVHKIAIKSNTIKR